MKNSRTQIAVGLAVVGVILLIGCIPIPATRQFQPNGKLRPEWAIGKNKEIRIGETKFDDAFIALSWRIADPNSKTAIRTGYWRVSPDKKRFTLAYAIRTGFSLWPLCFLMESVKDSRFLTLDVNEQGIVTHATTTDRPDEFVSDPEPQWLQIFDEPTRRKLRDAGVFPPDDALRAATQPSRHGVH